ncbi:MAG: carboxypeptidase-like regulatory domain-containing protein [Thermoplasmatota archaeon]
MRPFAVSAFPLVMALLMAGCAGSSPDPSEGGPQPTAAPPGVISGVVVDEALRPIDRATVELVGANRTAETDEGGAFAFTDVEPGTHFLRASHPLFDSAQHTIEVPADGSRGATVKIQLDRVIFASPYAQIQKFDGFLVCSIGFFVYASEECGEGVGVPCEVPVLGCQRVGGQGNNHAQWDFYLDGAFVATLVVEMTWESTSPTLEEFELNVANDWTCDPFCNGESLNVTRGVAPLYATVDFPRELTDRDGNAIELTEDTRFSTFVWPNWGHGDPSQADVAINQRFTQFATAFYYLPAPAGWSFLNGDEVPT